MNGGFSAAIPTTLAGVEQFCHEDHLNWLQIVNTDTNPGVDSTGTRLVPPYVDPPLGGYGDDPNSPGDETLWGDNLLWLYNEGPPPNPLPPGFAPDLQLSARTHISSLDYQDFPEGPPCLLILAAFLWRIRQRKRKIHSRSFQRTSFITADQL